MAKRKHTDGIERRLRADGKTVSYRVLIRRTGYPTVTKTFSKLENARTWKRTMEGDIETGKATGRSPLAKRKTVSDAIDLYMAGEGAKKRDNSLPYKIEYWRNAAGSIRLADLELMFPTLIEGLEEEKGTGSTANRYVAALRAVIKAAKGKKWIHNNPVAEYSKHSEAGTGRERVITKAEWDALMEASDELAEDSPARSPARQLRTFLTILYETAARKSEVRFLRWEDVHLDDGYAVLYAGETKSGQGRELILVPKVVELLREHRKQSERDGYPWVFPGRSMYRPAAFDEPFRQARARAGIKPDRRGEPLVIHSLRHSVATELGEGGATEFEIMAVTGHVSSSQVRRYVKNTRKMAESALAKRRRAK